MISATRRHAARAAAGFTLIELLVVFALVALMLALAAPSFINFQRNAQLTSTANSFIASLSAARAEAMKRQLRTFVAPIDGDWAKGWIVFVDVNSNLAQDAGDIEVSRQVGIPPTVTVAINAVSNGFTDPGSGDMYAMFNGAGFMALKDNSFQSGVLELTNGDETRRIVANPAGRIRVCKPADAGCNGTDL